MSQISPVFSVPLVWDFYANSQELNRKLKTLFLAKQSDPKVRNPNPYTVRNSSLFESHFDLFSWPDAEIKELSNFCCRKVLEAVADLNGYDAQTMKRVRLSADSWFHVTTNGGFFGIHNHPMASWSGVYCVDSGDPDPSFPTNAHLTFINPFIMNTMFVDAGNAHLRAPYTQQSMGYELKAGQLVLFPSWLLHEVKPYIGKGTRITVAFNCWFHLQN